MYKDSRAEGGRQLQPHLQGYQGSSRLVRGERMDSDLTAPFSAAADTGPRGAWTAGTVAQACRFVSAGYLAGNSVWNLTIPLGPSDPAVLSVRANVSHLWLWIGEVSGGYSKNVAAVARRAFCKLTVSSSHAPANGRGYLMYEPIMEDVKVFSPPWRPSRLSGSAT
jgi:hypothetical protein